MHHTSVSCLSYFGCLSNSFSCALQGFDGTALLRFTSVCDIHASDHKKLCCRFLINLLTWLCTCYESWWISALHNFWDFVLQVIFMQIPPMHPHIYSNGHICLGEYQNIILLVPGSVHKLLLLVLCWAKGQLFFLRWNTKENVKLHIIFFLLPAIEIVCYLKTPHILQQYYSQNWPSDHVTGRLLWSTLQNIVE